MATDLTRFTATTYGQSGVFLLWANDSATNAGSYAILRGATTIGTVSVPQFHYLDAAGVAGDTYHVQSTGRTLDAVARPAPTLTLVSSAVSGVSLSWTAASGATGYTLYAKPNDGARYTLARAHQVYSGTDLAAVDTDPGDGALAYTVKATFSDGSCSFSNLVATTLVRDTTASPLVRSYDLGWTGGVFECDMVYQPLHFPPTWDTTGPGHGEYAGGWIEDHAEMIYGLRQYPDAMARFGPASVTTFQSYVGDTTQRYRRRIDTDLWDIVADEYNGHVPANWVSRPRFQYDGSTGRFASGGLTHILSLASGSAAISTYSLNYDATTSMLLGQMRFGFTIDGATTWPTAYSPRTVEYNPVTGQVTMTLGWASASSSFTVTVVAIKSKLSVSASVTNGTAVSHTYSVAVRHTHTSASTKRHEATRAFAQVSELGATANPSGRIAMHVKTSSRTWTSSTLDTSAMQSSVNLGTVAAAGTVSDNISDVWHGFAPWPTGYLSGFGSATPDDDAVLGGSTEQGRPVLFAAYLEHFPEDSTAKNALLGFLGTMYAERNNANLNGNDAALRGAVKASLAYAYWVLASKYPGESDYATRRNTLATELQSANAYGWPGAQTSWTLNLLGYPSAADAAQATAYNTWLNDYDANTKAISFLLGYLYNGFRNKTEARALNILSYLLRNVQVFNSTQFFFATAQDRALDGTGEAIGWALNGLADLAAQSGGITPCFIGRTWNTYGNRTDGSITAWTYNAGSKSLSVTFDKDVWLHCPGGRPSSITTGGASLTELGADPGTTPMTNGGFWFDPVTNVLKVGTTSSRTVEISATGAADFDFALPATQTIGAADFDFTLPGVYTVSAIDFLMSLPQPEYALTPIAQLHGRMECDADGVKTPCIVGASERWTTEAQVYWPS